MTGGSPPPSLLLRYISLANPASSNNTARSTKSIYDHVFFLDIITVREKNLLTFSLFLMALISLPLCRLTFLTFFFFILRFRIMFIRHSRMRSKSYICVKYKLNRNWWTLFERSHFVEEAFYYSLETRSDALKSFVTNFLRSRCLFSTSITNSEWLSPLSFYMYI